MCGTKTGSFIHRQTFTEISQVTGAVKYIRDSRTLCSCRNLRSYTVSLEKGMGWGVEVKFRSSHITGKGRKVDANRRPLWSGPCPSFISTVVLKYMQSDF